MHIKKIDAKESKFMRIPLAQGGMGDSKETFTISLLADAKGFVIEFEKATYFLAMEDLVVDIIKETMAEKIKEARCASGISKTTGRDTTYR